MGELFLHLFQQAEEHVGPKRIEHDHDGVIVEVEFKDVPCDNLDVGVGFYPLPALLGDLFSQFHASEFPFMSPFREEGQNATFATADVQNRIIFREMRFAEYLFQHPIVRGLTGVHLVRMGFRETD